MKEVTAAVIGAGNMGKNHARNYANLPGVRLVGVADPNAEVGRKVAEEYGVSYYSDHRELLSTAQPDVVSVVVPTKLHLSVGRDALSSCRVVLIEKPLAVNDDDGRELVSAAAESKSILTVGHIERYNPTVRAVRRAIDTGEIGRPLKIQFRRESADPSRIRDANVLVDIGIHDIDLACWMMGKRPTRYEAEGGAYRREWLEDYATLTMAFANADTAPTIVTIQVSWVNQAKIRKIEIVGSEGYLTADLISRKVLVGHELIEREEYTDYEDYLRKAQSQKFRELPVDETEALLTELCEVVKAARGEDAELVSPTEALTAVSIAKHATLQIRSKNQTL